jgi:uncharacterized membrane protein
VSRLGVAWWQACSFVAGLAGTGVAVYLVRVHYDEGALICTVGDCKTVQESEYAEVWGIPIALFGLGMYLVVLALGIARWRRPDWHVPATLTAFGLALSGALYAAYLTYLELAVIEAICQWCVASAVLTVVILIAEGIGVWRWLSLPPEPGSDDLDPSRATPVASAAGSRASRTLR